MMEPEGTEEQVLDSPMGWVKSHIQDYVDSDGQKGHQWRGFPTLLLTTRGRKTGKWHRTALIYGEHEGKYVIVASKGGADTHPNWYLNLLKYPDVEVQVGAKKLKASARPATPEEKPSLWQLMAQIYPPYNDYQKKTSREIPVVVLEPV
jgi:deazaflavin-dependent oxidoreductase (nitroreductase family)